jgi:hypothetical protein
MTHEVLDRDSLHKRFNRERERSQGERGALLFTHRAIPSRFESLYQIALVAFLALGGLLTICWCYALVYVTFRAASWLF